MNEVLVNSLYQRVKSGQMTVKQVPIPFKDLVQELLDLEEWLNENMDWYIKDRIHDTCFIIS